MGAAALLCVGLSGQERAVAPIVVLQARIQSVTRASEPDCGQIVIEASDHGRKTAPFTKVEFCRTEPAFSRAFPECVQEPMPQFEPGLEIRVHGLARGDTVEAAAIEKKVGKTAPDTPEAYGERAKGYSLQYVRSCFDLAAPTVRDSEFWTLSASIVSGHNLYYSQSRALWVQREIGRILSSYSNRSVAANLIARFGRPDLVQNIDGVHNVLAHSPRRVVVIKVLPFMVRDVREQRIGGWDVFPLEIWAIERGRRRRLL